MTLCVHCGFSSEDDMFCDGCGKLISDTNNVEQVECGRYKDISVPCVSRLSNMGKEDIRHKDFELIEVPISVVKSENEDCDNELYFVKNEDISLEEYLELNTLNKNDVSTILYRIYCIMSEIQECGYVLGSVDLCDLWMKDENLSTLYYRQTRRFLVGKDDLEIELGEIQGIPMIDSNNQIDQRMDVTLLGRIFMKLATEMKYEFEGYLHERYVAYNMQLFSKIVEKEMNIWLEKTITMDDNKMYPSIDECIEAFNWLQAPKCLDGISDDLIDVEAVWGTDVGIGKNEKMKHVPESERNEDSILMEEVIERVDGGEITTKALFLVADGVSNSDIGTGQRASRILKEVSYRLWDEMFDDINDIQMAQEFVNRVIRESNEQIWEYVSESVEGCEIGLKMPMATTMSIAIKVNNKLYYASMGDSPIMLLNDNGLIPLTLDDNKGNESLVNGCKWSKFTEMDGASSLTKCIGGKNSIPGNENRIGAKVSEITLVEGEMLLMCSDGLTDYIGAGLDVDIEWKKKEILEGLLREEKELEEMVDDLIDVANLNGGGDNISIILARFN